jgi:hypothetical protein
MKQGAFGLLSGANPEIVGAVEQLVDASGGGVFRN